MELETAMADEAARTGFSGAIRVDRAGETLLAAAYGLADRAHRVPNTVATRFATASGTKGLTALVVMALVEREVLALDTSARSLLGADLPLVGDDVTVEHLLGHTSGIGDYVHEGDGEITDHVLTVPVHTLETTEDYLTALDGHPAAAPAGAEFRYCNAGFVVLALLAERASGTPFADLVETLVCAPAGLRDTGFLRSDSLPGDAALGYLYAEGLRTNALHLPVVGSGDGGAYTTLADLHSLWSALEDGRVIAPTTYAAMVRPRNDWPEEDRRYGLGFHLHATDDAVFLEGYDAGVSMWTQHEPSSATTYTVLANWSDGAWPVLRRLDELLASA